MFILTVSFGSAYPSICSASGLDELIRQCAPMIHPNTMKAVVTVESSKNPFAVGVVGGALSRQPKTLEEAIGVVKMLESESFNYSVGISQVNKYNLKRLGLDIKSAFDPCENLKGGGTILQECYERALKSGMTKDAALRAALSCYYSGDFWRGERLGYVNKVMVAADRPGGKKEPPIRIVRTKQKKKNSRETEAWSEPKAIKEKDRAFVF